MVPFVYIYRMYIVNFINSVMKWVKGIKSVQQVKYWIKLEM